MFSVFFYTEFMLLFVIINVVCCLLKGKVSSVVPPSSVSPSAFSTYTRSASRQNDLECSPRRTSLSARHVSPLSSTEPPNDIADQPIVAKVSPITIDHSSIMMDAFRHPDF